MGVIVKSPGRQPFVNYGPEERKGCVFYWHAVGWQHRCWQAE